MTWMLEPLHGPVVAAVAAAIVSPAAAIVLCLVAERRAFRLQEQYLAFVFGDLALAASIGAGANAYGVVAVCIPLVLAAGVLALGLVLGVVQGWHDVASRRYTWGQVFSPTKLWHQVVAIPLLLCWLTVGVVATIVTRHWLGLAVWLGGVAVWLVFMIYNRSHPKSAHVDVLARWRRPTTEETR